MSVFQIPVNCDNLSVDDIEDLLVSVLELVEASQNSGTDCYCRSEGRVEQMRTHSHSGL